MDGIVELTESTFSEEMKSVAGKLLVIDFWAPWCAPCRVLTPIITQLAIEVAEDDGVRIMKVNIDDGQDIAATYGIRGVPHILFMKDGNVLDGISGIRGNKAAMLKLLHDKIAQWR